MRRLRRTLESAVRVHVPGSDSQRLAAALLGEIIESITITESDDLTKIPTRTRIKDQREERFELRSLENHLALRWVPISGNYLREPVFPAVVEEWGDEK